MNKSSYLPIKRTADIILSGGILLSTAPLLLLIMILIKLESKGPVFYIQKRVGKNGRIFDVYKLRTMYTDIKDIGGGIRTEKDDPRITKIGRMIRRCSLDEFPQFYNILKGDMSYIGPRPISVEEHLAVIEEIVKKSEPLPQGIVHKVKPGITGWALLHGREQISYENRFKLNAEYENNLSLGFDLKVFFLTFKKYLFTYMAVIILFAALLFALWMKFIH